MDTRYFGTNLLPLNENQAARRSSSTKGAEDAYYERHTPAGSSIPRITSVLAAASFGFVTIGYWLR